MMEIIIVLVIFWIACSAFSWAIAGEKGLDAWAYGVIGLLLGPIGVLVAALATDSAESQAKKERAIQRLLDPEEERRREDARRRRTRRALISEHQGEPQSQSLYSPDLDDDAEDGDDSPGVGLRWLVLGAAVLGVIIVGTTAIRLGWI
jgi:hypothetical protein